MVSLRFHYSDLGGLAPLWRAQSMKNEEIDIQGCEMETYAKGEEAPWVVQETKTGVHPRLLDHLLDCSLRFEDDLDVCPG
jgi:hypothetical protein